MKIVYIHGATASERSFAFIQQNICADDTIYLNYDKHTSAESNLLEMRKLLSTVNESLFFVCHSLGGVYAIYLQNEFAKQVEGVVSLATPFNGSEIATWGRMLNPGYQLFKDISPQSEFIKNSRKIKIQCPWTQVIAGIGDVPWLSGRNDGIVTQASMTCRRDVDYETIDRNHYEMLLSQRAVDIIKKLVYK